MKKTLVFLFLSLSAVAVIYFLGLQLAYIYVENMLSWAIEHNSLFMPTLNPSYFFFDENHYYIWILHFLAGAAIIEIFFNTIFSKSERELWKNRRLLTPAEKKNYTHLSSKHDAKKGMQRMQFDRFGHLRDKTPVQAAGIFLRMVLVYWGLGRLRKANDERGDDCDGCGALSSSAVQVAPRNRLASSLSQLCFWGAFFMCFDVAGFTSLFVDLYEMFLSGCRWVWERISVVHSGSGFVVILWGLILVVAFKVSVILISVCISLLKDHVMPSLHGYGTVKRFCPAVAVILGCLIRSGRNLYLSMILWYLLLVMILQVIDLFVWVWRVEFGFRSLSQEQLEKEISYLRESFCVLKRACGLKEEECRDDRFYLSSIVLLYRACTFRNTVDAVFDGLKRGWNRLCIILELPDHYKMNTIHTYQIGGEKKHFRGGLPVLSYLRKIYVDADDDHTLIVSSSKSGKSWSFILILIDSCRMAGESMIINDPKAEILAEKYQCLINDGYEVRVVNFIDPEHSDGWNPLYMIARSYVDEKEEYEKKKKELEEQLDQMKDDDPRQGELLTKLSQLHVDHSRTDIYIEDLKKQLTYDKDAKDKTWDASSGDVIAGLVYLLLEEFDREDSDITIDQINFKSVQAVFNEAIVMVREGREKVTKLSQWLKLKKPKEDKSYEALASYATASDPTRKSIDITFRKNTNYLNIDEGVQKLLSKSTFDFKEIGRKKTAVFIVVHGDKNTYYPLVSLMVDQMYTQLMELAREQYAVSGKERLPVPVTMVFDEFGIFPPLGSIANIMTFARSAGFRMVMACQDFNQLADTYGEYVSRILQNNSMNFVYLMGQDPDTLQRIENMCGFKLEWSNETKRYEKVPTVTKERLGTLSVGEALIKMQRRNPLITRFRGHDRYIYYKNLKHGYEFQGEVIPPAQVYDLAGRLDARLARTAQINSRNGAAASLYKTPVDHELDNSKMKQGKLKSEPGIHGAKSWGIEGWKTDTN